VPNVVLPREPQTQQAIERKPDYQPAVVIYAQAQEAVERIFDDLERGVPPTPEATKAIVSNVLDQVLNDRAAIATQVAIQKIKQFDRSLTTHALDTCILSLIVAIESELDQPLQELVGMGALLHDAGYVRLPRNLVRKRDECTGQDKTLLEQHCKLGVTLLSEHPGMHEEVLRIVREHHERSDKSGFPAGLGHDQISPLAQIVGIVDFYDGMVSRRGTRPAMIPHDAVRQLFLAGERGQFEKTLVEVMIRSIGVYPVGSLVRLNTGEQAVVVGVNPQQRLKPLVKVTTDPQGGSYTTPIEIDLSASSSDHTVRTVLRVLDPARERVNIGIHLDTTLPRAA
ncbi:MAG: HD domain-containing protein, partial [Nitrospira sp.]|nr:HD domain-containing protein [Nitrospira sp.]